VEKEKIVEEERVKIAAKVISFILGAMSRGSLQARDRFPRLLQLIDNPTTGKLFAVRSFQKIPFNHFLSNK
jgi:hypothetical protein